MPGTHQSGRVPARAVLAILADALDDMSRRIADLEAHAAALARSVPEDAGFRVALQDLDLVRQTLEDLGRLAAAAGSDDMHDAGSLADTLRLGALRDRLTPGPPEDASRCAVDPDTGQVDLFAPLGVPTARP